MARLCEKKAVSLEGDQRRAPYVPEKPQKPDPSFGNGAAHLRVRIEGGFAFATRNSYLPRLFESGEVNVNHFHEICGNICEGCYAATYESFAKHKLPPGRYHVPVSREQRSDASKKSDENEAYFEGNKKMFNAKINVISSITHIPKEDQWAPNAPYMSNADMERLSVHLIQSASNTYYVDAPVYDYRPLMCIMGAALPPPLATGRCYKNSEWDGTKCRCKSGMQDISFVPTISFLARERGYTSNQKGLICVRKPRFEDRSSTRQKYDVVAFVFEGVSKLIKGNALDNVRNFVRGLRSELAGTKVLFKTATASRGGWAFYNGVPSMTQIDEALYKHFPTGDTYKTFTATTISDVMWIKNLRDIPGKKLMFLFSGNNIVDREFMYSTIVWEKERFNWEIFGVRMPCFFTANKDMQSLPLDEYTQLDYFESSTTNAKDGLRTKFSYKHPVPYYNQDAYDAMKPS